MANLVAGTGVAGEAHWTHAGNVIHITSAASLLLTAGGVTTSLSASDHKQQLIAFCVSERAESGHSKAAPLCSMMCWTQQGLLQKHGQLAEAGAPLGAQQELPDFQHLFMWPHHSFLTW